MPVDPVCGRVLEENEVHIRVHHQGAAYSVCCPLCQTEFERHPEQYVRVVAPPEHRRSIRVGPASAEPLVYTVTVSRGSSS